MEDTIEVTTEEEQSAEDATFKFFIHKSEVLARILKDNIDELEGKSVEEIKKCLNLGADGNTVKGKDTEYKTRDGKTVILDSAFDVCIPGTDSNIRIIIGLEGVRLRRRIGIAQRSHGLNLNPCALSAYS